MIATIADNIQTFGPVFAFMWILTIVFTLWRPQRYFNSLLLMLTLIVTMLFVSGFFSGDGRASFLLICFIIVMLGLLLTPALLIINGIQLIRRESLCTAHLLSLGLGVFIGIGELATFGYVLEIASSNNGNLWIMLLAFTVFYFSYLVLSFVFYSIFIQIMPHIMDFNYIIIHGCGLAGGERMTKLLSDRVDKAIRIYEKCRVKPIIIPSGGQGPDEKLSEAQAMKDYLLEHGIPKEDIIMEDRSATTRENLINSKSIIDSREGRKKTALVSSNYHIYRCLRLAREVKLRCIGIGAHVAFYYWPSALIREFIAVFLSRGFLIWSIIGYLLFVSPILYGLLSG